MNKSIESIAFNQFNNSHLFKDAPEELLIQYIAQGKIFVDRCNMFNNAKGIAISAIAECLANKDGYTIFIREEK